MEELLNKEIKMGRSDLSYDRLHARSQELITLYDKTQDEKYVMEDYSLVHVMDLEHLSIYESIANYAKKVGAKRVFDIGCAYGHQSEVFLNEGLNYIGLETSAHDFWNKDKFEYMIQKYPCPIPVQEGDLGVSVLCLTWNCYLFEGKKTLQEQCEALQNDFEHCLIYTQKDHVEILGKYFKEVKQIQGNLYYFSNL